MSKLLTLSGCLCWTAGELVLALFLVITGPAVFDAVAVHLNDAPVIFASGKWSVRAYKDSMMDRVVCTGLYEQRFDIQVSEENFYIGLQGRGGVRGYTLRFDDNPAERSRVPDSIERDVSIVRVTGSTFSRLLSAKRLRVQVVTLLGPRVDEDIDLSDLPAAYEVIKGPSCSSRV